VPFASPCFRSAAGATQDEPQAAHCQTACSHPNTILQNGACRKPLVIISPSPNLARQLIPSDNNIKRPAAAVHHVEPTFTPSSAEHRGLYPPRQDSPTLHDCCRYYARQQTSSSPGPAASPWIHHLGRRAHRLCPPNQTLVACTSLSSPSCLDAAQTRYVCT
jgi:hypothetical protein